MGGRTTRKHPSFSRRRGAAARGQPKTWRRGQRTAEDVVPRPEGSRRRGAAAKVEGDVAPRPEVLMKPELGDLGNRETPCAAQPAGASAPPRAFQGWEASTIARSSGVTLLFEQFHRPSELALWRAIRFDDAHSPGFPVRLSRRGWLVRPGCPARLPQPADVVAPVAWCAFRRRHRLGRSPVSRFRLRRQRMFPHRSRFRLVNPVGRSNEATLRRRAPLTRGRSSGSGWRALAGASPTLHLLFHQVKRYF